MRLGFFSQGLGPHHEMAKLMLASAKKHMPGLKLYHLTDADTEALAEPIRIPEALPLAVKRTQFYAQLMGDWLYVDTDILFTRDVRDIFDKEFDLAFAKRNEVNDYARAMPYNLGVVFSRNHRFWADILQAVKDLPPKLQEWDGLQLASGWYATRKWCPYKILELPGEYNYTPKSKDEDVSDKAIVHYKGLKPKEWLQSIQSP